ncbi:MAG: gluconate 2-dehydrogenase subunit 3 family protein [Bacteroidota bacterium]|nr:gluconate 2-dehydrogenase subunit 3 family protein [Bacteroidota bacterium]
MLLDACKEPGVKAKGNEEKSDDTALNIDRTDREKEVHKALVSQTFFTKHEMETIAVLSDIIIPADEVSGSATDAGVPAFIEYIVKDKPEYQTPMRGGIRWLDMQMGKLYGTSFKDSKPDQRIAVVDAIAFPAKAKPELNPGVAFFSLMRNLTATGFYSSEMGMKDVGYVGNRPNQWNGVPDEVLKQYKLAYTEKELKECVKYA